jgi:CheY-like chemotaxis protein
MSGTTGAGKRGVLVVDDEVFLRNLLVRTLKSLGADGWPAEDGPTALAVFAQHASAIDLALIDLHLPDMDGEAVAAALHQLDAALPCCLMTGGPSIPPPPGFCCALAKPFLADDLAALLATCLRAPGP